MGELTTVQNDLDAFGRLVEQHQTMIRAFVTARIDDPFEAEDIAQETFLIAFRKLPEIDQSQSLRPWLCTIAANLVKNFRRKRRAHPVGGGNDAILNLLDAEIEALTPAWQENSITDALTHCLSKLGDEARNLIRLRYEEGHRIAEIRKMSGGKHSAITMKLHRLRDQLRVCIENQIKEASHG